MLEVMEAVKTVMKQDDNTEFLDVHKVGTANVKKKKRKEIDNIAHKTKYKILYLLEKKKVKSRSYGIPSSFHSFKRDICN